MSRHSSFGHFEKGTEVVVKISHGQVHASERKRRRRSIKRAEFLSLGGRQSLRIRQIRFKEVLEIIEESKRRAAAQRGKKSLSHDYPYVSYMR